VVFIVPEVTSELRISIATLLKRNVVGVERVKGNEGDGSSRRVDLVGNKLNGVLVHLVLAHLALSVGFHVHLVLVTS